MSIAVSSRRLAATFALAASFLAPAVAFAQADADQPAAGAPKPKKKPATKKKKPAADTPPPASADDTSAAPPAKDDAKPAAVDADSPAPAPAADAAPKDDKAAKVVAAPDEAAPKEPDANDDTNTFEDPNTRYYFVGARYRGTVIPQFIENLFVDDGSTVYSNSFGFELDMRKGGQSMIPWITYADYSMGDTLFHEKGATPTGQMGDAGNITVVNSSLKAIYIGLDELWSVPLDKSHHWDFEFGFGVGVGVVFGSLQNNWVYQNNAGNLSANGFNYSECTQFTTDISCQLAGHTGATTRKVGGYTEPNWFNGGAVPVFFPHISFPQLSVRYKPIKQMEARVGLGFSLTGFWFALSADYGLESTDKKPVKPAAASLRMHDML
jgi:hypothetical protein